MIHISSFKTKIDRETSLPRKVEQIETIENPVDMHTLDKHLKQFKGEVSLVKTYVKNGKKVRIIKIKSKRKKMESGAGTI